MCSIVPIIIPAYEPDERLPVLLEGLKNEIDDEILIVNDGSGPACDAVFAKAKRVLPDCVLLNHPENRGKGAALKTAFRYVKEKIPDAVGVVTADCDGQHTPEDIARIRDTLTDHPDSLVLGMRTFNAEDIPFKSRAGNLITRRVFALVSGKTIQDTQTGLRGIPMSFLDDCLKIKENRYSYEMEMLLESTNMNIIEIPIQTVYDSKEHHTTHFHPWRDSFQIYRVILKRFLAFILSSLSSAVVDVSLFTLFERGLRNVYPDWSVMMATVGARIISSIWNYCINRHVVFQSKKKGSATSWKYFALVIVQMLASGALTSVSAMAFARVSVTVLKMIVDVLLFLISYQIQNKWIF